MDVNPVAQRLARLYGPSPPSADQNRGVASDGTSAEVASLPQSSSDGLVLSQLARDIPRVRQIVAGTPDVRTERVSKLQRDIRNGSYRVDIPRLASRLVFVLGPTPY